MLFIWGVLKIEGGKQPSTHSLDVYLGGGGINLKMKETL